MKFTDKFIKLPIKTYDRMLRDVGIEDEGELMQMRIDPEAILRYIDVSSDEETVVKVWFKNSKPQDFYLSIEEFENLLNTL